MDKIEDLYLVSELKDKWEEYHDLVHPGDAPCDACPGDLCYTGSFLFWLEHKRIPTKEERNKL